MNKNLQDQLFDTEKSIVKRYQELQLGTNSIWYLIKYELIVLISAWVPGALGMLLRKLLYPRILGSVGRNVVFGHGMTIRHGLKISIGSDVVIDDCVVLDAKGPENMGITIGDEVVVSRNVVISSKNGCVSVGDRCALGVSTVIHGMLGSDVIIGNDVLVGAFTYFIGGAGYHTSDLHMPFKKQGGLSKGGIRVADNVWFGSHVKIMDGVSVGSGVIVGCSTLVNKDVKDLEIIAGVPMRVIDVRGS